ncbi:protein MOS2 [Punica granatum]|nr:protein MOS2 [Punica granatum]
MQFTLNPSKKPSKPPAKPVSRTFGFGGGEDGHGEPAPSKPTYVTEFDPSKDPTDAKPQVSIIPPKPNEWRPHKKMKNLDLPLQAEPTVDLNKFESQPRTLDDEANASSVSYGLTLRKGGSDGNSSNGQPANERIEPEQPRKFASLEVQRLNEDLEGLGDDPGFEDMPVEGYGAALLAGYGWQEGRGIGRNSKEDVKVRQYERGVGKEGLGFQPDKIQLRDEAKERGRGRNQRRDEGRSSVKRDTGVSVGKEIRIVGGSEDSIVGLKGEVLDVVRGGEAVVLRLSQSGEEVRVRAEDVAELGSREEEKCLKKLKEMKIRNDSNGGSRKRRSKEVKRASSDGSGNNVRWLTNHIRVRVISKDLKGGRLYRKKGKVLDVVGPMSCDLLMDETRELIQGVDQVLLETALPKRGGPVLVLSGRYKGVHGSLVERDLDRETGIVRDADTHELFNVRLEQIAEYVEDPSLVGY